MDNEKKTPDEEPMKVARGGDVPIPKQGFQHEDVPKRVADEA